jgi:hypothetical protein
MGIGEEPFRTWLISFISFIPVSPFSYTKEPTRSKRAAPYLRRSFWKARNVVVPKACMESRRVTRLVGRTIGLPVNVLTIPPHGPYTLSL